MAPLTASSLKKATKRVLDTPNKQKSFHMIDNLPPLVLASASPRRKDLMAEMNLDFKVDPADIIESCWQGEKPEDYAVKLAEEKLAAVTPRHCDGIVIAADTVVAVKDEVLGKPEDKKDAKRMLELSGDSVQSVITGVAFHLPGNKPEMLSGFAETRVTMRKISEKEIEEYISSGEAMGKAGAYAIQETGDRFVTKLDGDFDNVVGLPMEIVLEVLNTYAKGTRDQETLTGNRLKDILPGGAIALLKDKGKYLLIERAAGESYPGYWCLPGGGIEKNETSEKAVCRECLEEIAIKIRPVKKIWESICVGGSHWLHWWEVEPLEDIINIRPDKKECSNAKFMTKEEILNHKMILRLTKEFFQYRLP